ncbi:unnamed protein product, partial [Mesorhabditis belari]|uniref:Uncharacterized protein n=1 Tax=Mesorhabditis belari TaxID=2138241 RepID=A0AAF3EC72_9BILA
MCRQCDRESFCGWKSLRELLHLGPETSTKCSDYEQKKSAESSYLAYKAWLKNESPEVQQALAANKPFLKKFFSEFDATFCKHPKPSDPLNGKLFKMNFGGAPNEPALIINKAKVEEKLANFNEQTKQKVNSIKEKYAKKNENPPPAHK